MKQQMKVGIVGTGASALAMVLLPGGILVGPLAGIAAIASMFWAPMPPSTGGGELATAPATWLDRGFQAYLEREAALTERIRTAPHVRIEEYVRRDAKGHLGLHGDAHGPGVGVGGGWFMDVDRVIEFGEATGPIAIQTPGNRRGRRHKARRGRARTSY
ncbi:MAG TPA: hypothetical protein VGH80_10905 [Xanthomonadaceae bacterium]|jgi:hypothetical protein